MRVAALYDVHAMPWALEAVLAEVDADAIVFGGDYLYGPCPRETVAIVRSLDAQVLRGNCEDLAEDWERAQLEAGDLEWLQSLPLAVDGRRRPLLPRGAGRQHCRSRPPSRPTTRSRETFAGHTGTIVIGHTHHQFDRRSATCASSTPARSGMPYEGDVAAFWTLVDDGEPTFRCARRSTSSAPSRETRASAWPHAQEFVAENLLAAGDARRGDRRAREPRVDEGSDRARSAARTGSTARSSSSSRATTTAGGRPARASSPAGHEVEVVAHRTLVRPAGDQARPARRARRGARGRARRAAADRRRTSTTPSSSSG